eukprot:6485680-Amphidinium_carterae.1
MKRCTLSVFTSVYEFVERYPKTMRPMWDSVRREIRWARSVIPLIFVNMRQKWGSVIYATDASEQGRGVLKREFPLEAVEKLGQTRERWRFRASLPTGMSHREATLSQHEYFEHVPREVINGTWSVVSSNRWHRSEHIVVLEGRSLVHALKHLLRGKSALDHNHVFLTDSLVCAGCLSKGRSSSSGLCRIARQWCALQLASGVNVHLRWLPSEQNPADLPSRQHMLCGSIINWEWEKNVSKEVVDAGAKREYDAWETGSWVSEQSDTASEHSDCDESSGQTGEAQKEAQGGVASDQECTGPCESTDGGGCQREDPEHLQGYGTEIGDLRATATRSCQRVHLRWHSGGLDESRVSKWGSLVQGLLHDRHSKILLPNFREGRGTEATSIDASSEGVA